jgi:hypothetical protein
MTNKEHPKNVRGNEFNHHQLKRQYVKTTTKNYNLYILVK